MGKKVVVKKGEKYTLHASCQFAGCDSEDTFVADSDITEDEMQELVDEFMYDSIGPEGWWEKCSE